MHFLTFFPPSQLTSPDAPLNCPEYNPHAILITKPKSQSSKDIMAPDHKACLSTSRRPDYPLVACYVLMYLELGWLIMMLLRSSSRD